MNDAKLDLLLNKMEAMQLQLENQTEQLKQLIQIAESTLRNLEAYKTKKL